MSTATPARKPAAAASTTPSTSLRKPVSQQTTPNRATSPGKTNGSPQVLSGVARSPSTRANPTATRPARAASRRGGSIAGASGQSAADIAKEEDAKAENAAVIDGLKESVRNAESMSDDYQKQLANTQQRVDELLKEHAKMEERLQETLEKNEELQTEKKEATRALREAGNIYESEKAAMLKDREESAVREEELRSTIQNLKDKLVGRDSKTEEEQREGRPPTRDESVESETQFAPSSTISKLSPQRSDSKSTSRLVMQKDQVIESLRLELAEAQIKLVEMENQGGGRMAELEKTLLETRMTNARLMEDNESYQLLLGEKTMNGELAKSEVLQHNQHSSVSGLGSLAEELDTAADNDERLQKLHDRVKVLEDEKKALTLYVDKMLTKIMNTADQMALLDKDDSIEKKPSSSSSQNSQEAHGVAQNVMAGISRSLSVFNKRQRPTSMLTVSSQPSHEEGQIQQPRSRPTSGIIAPAPTDGRKTAHNNPLTAPSIPLGRSASVQMRARGHRRTQSSQSAISPAAGEAPASLGANMGPPPAPMQRQLSGSRSPGIDVPHSAGIGSGPSTPRNSFAPSVSTRAASSASNTPGTGSITDETNNPPPTSGSSDSQRMSGSGASFASNENASIEAGGREPGAPSPPRNAGGQTNYTGAVMTQNKLRPLRLVQQEKEEREAEEQARKKANRASWMGWLNRGPQGGPHPQTIDEQSMS